MLKPGGKRDQMVGSGEGMQLRLYTHNWALFPLVSCVRLVKEFWRKSHNHTDTLWFCRHSDILGGMVLLKGMIFFEHISFLEIILLFHFWKFHLCIQYILAHSSPTPSLQLSLSPNISSMSFHQFHVLLRITHWSIWICPYMREYILVNRHSAKYFCKVLLLLPTNVCRTALAILFYMWRHSIDTC